MPSYIKVSGNQRTIIAPFVKVAGTWRQAIFIYTKINGTWRQGFAANVEDDFNRADQTPLGTVSNFVTSWTALRQTWSIFSNQARTTNDASTYPLAVVAYPRQTTDYEINLDVVTGAGAGVSFWATDSQNWWGATTNTTYSATYACPAGGTLSGTTCSRDDSYTAPFTTATTNYSAGSYSAGGSYTPNYGSCTSTISTVLKTGGYYSYNGGETYTSGGTVCDPPSVGACALTFVPAQPAVYSCPDGSNRASYTVTSGTEAYSYYTPNCGSCVPDRPGCSRGCSYVSSGLYNCRQTCSGTTSTVYCTLVQAGSSATSVCEGPSNRGYSCARNGAGQCREIQSCTTTPSGWTCPSGGTYFSTDPNGGGFGGGSAQGAGCYTYVPLQCPSGYSDIGGGYCQRGIPNYCANGSCTTSDASGTCLGPTVNVPASCSCPSGYSSSWSGTQADCARGTVCSIYYPPERYCPNGGNLSGTMCLKTTLYAATGTFTYQNSVKVLRAIAGSVSTMQTFNAGSSVDTSTDPLYTFTNASRIGSLRVTTANNTVTLVSYTGAQQTGTSNTFTYTATSPTKTMYAGILVGPADHNAGATVDNFLLK